MNDLSVDELTNSYKLLPDETIRKVLCLLHDETDINLQSYIACIRFANLLMISVGNPPIKSQKHNPDLLVLNEKNDNRLVELIAGLQEAYLRNLSLQNEYATLQLIDQSKQLGPWFEELIVLIAENALIPPELFTWFLARTEKPYGFDGDLYMNSRSGRSGVAANANTPQEILCELSEYEDWEIRWRLAMNLSTSSDLLNKLCRSAGRMAEVINACVALHRNSSEETLLYLVEKGGPDIRTLVTRNDSATSFVVSRAHELGTVEIPFKEWGPGLAWILDKELE